ncbi:MAG: phenylalanine--tRNA ligase subunit beta [Patescibacteria group bacterium]|nr:phenylalanine--tRNA ligase subunit beta [Patescibacteria group bacterium]
MKFSYSLIKKFAPGKYSKEELIRAFNTYSFEAVDLGGDVFEIPNTAIAHRFSTGSSHLGVAREAAAIFNVKYIDPTLKKVNFDFKDRGVFKINIKEKDLCLRYSATYVTDVKVGSSPKWLKDVLEACGLRSINNVVDIMNYVMLETGQPLHAFDADKVLGGIIVRRAGAGEDIETIDGNKFKLSEDILVIADEDRPLAIAGIKGGKHSEVSLNTNKLLVESANFEGVGIYKSSVKLGLRTDASVSFSHDLSPEEEVARMKRALMLLKEICGAKIHRTDDIYPKKQPKTAIKFDLEKISRIIGVKIKKIEAQGILAKLGFSFSKNLIIVPALRNDIEIIEDIAEEVARMKNFNELPAIPPSISMIAGREDEIVLIKEKVRKYLTAVGYSEVYNYSFVSEDRTKISPSEVFGIKKPVKLANPLSVDLAFLRNSLAPYLEKNLKDNLRFFNEVRVFEIGKIFGDVVSGGGGSVIEKTILGIAMDGKDAFFELKGLVDGLFADLGLVDWLMPDLDIESDLLRSRESLKIELGDNNVVGYIGILKNSSHGAVLELDLEKISKAVIEEKEYEPLSIFPSIDRDISILVSSDVRVGDVLEIIQTADPEHVDDVDLVDFYQDEKFGDKKSLTFRIVFQANDRTLTDQEVDRELEKIVAFLKDRVGAEVR